jgi:hypothetical protein
MWNHESRRAFYQKAAVNLDLSKYDEAYYNAQLQNYRNFKLNVSFTYQESWDALLLKLKEFTAVHSGSIKSLQISAAIPRSLDLRLLKSILELHQNITSLDLTFAHFAEFVPANLILNEIEPLLRVSKLRIDFGNRFRKYLFGDTILLAFARKMLRLAPEICELQLDKDAIEIFLSEIIKLQGDVIPGDPLPFGNLSTLRFDNWDDNLPSLCLKMSQKLRVLTMKRIPYLYSACSSQISKLLEKHSDTLESLTISYESWGSGRKQQKVHSVVYPKLPRLTNLSVSVIGIIEYYKD